MTTVLATETAMPRIKPLCQLQPIATASPMQARVAAVLCASAPGIASERTASRSFKLKCRPTPNISRITPISASSDAILRVAHDARRVRANQHTRDEVADDRRKPEAPGD